jgi:hypothetical protein
MSAWTHFACARYEFQRAFMLAACRNIYFTNGSKKYSNLACWNAELVDISFGFDILALPVGLILRDNQSVIKPQSSNRNRTRRW